MKPDKFIDSMNNIDESIVEEYESSKLPAAAPQPISEDSVDTSVIAKPEKEHDSVPKASKGFPLWAKITTIAAAFVVIATVALILFLGGTSPISGDPEDNKNPESISEAFEILSIEAEMPIGRFISGDTAFIVKTKEGSTEGVRRHLMISEAYDYTVTETEKDVYSVKLSHRLKDNTVVSLSYVKDGLVDKSWAFQTETKLSLSSSYPENDARTIPVDSVIELEFSYATAEGIEDAVTFEPHIDGTWSHMGKVWRFTPSSNLDRESTYIINVGKGITADGKAIEETAAITFSTYEGGRPYYVSADIITVDGINSFRPTDDIYVRYTGSAPVGTVSVKQFASYTDMIAFADGESDFAMKDYKNCKFTEYSTPESVFPSTTSMKLSDKLPQGYYVARVFAEDGTHLFDWIIQVHPLSLYATVTERDVLVWAALDGKLAEGVHVSYEGNEGKTAADGTLLLEDAHDGSGKVRYLLAGDVASPLVMGSPTFTHQNYPGSYIYTDRPKYKSDDTIHIWGFVPLDLFYDKPDGKFEVLLDEETDTAVEVTPDKNGAFECTLDVVNHVDEYSNIILQYNGSQLASDPVQIVDYSLKNYSYELLPGKNFVVSGEDICFDVRMSHISGINVKGKTLLASSYDVSARAVTDQNGVAHFRIPYAEYEDEISGKSDFFEAISYIAFTVSDPDGGVSENNLSFEFFVFNGSPLIKHDLIGNTIKVQAYNVNTSGLSYVDRGTFYSASSLTDLPFCGAPATGKVTINLSLEKRTREIEETKVDEFTKTQYHTYTDSKDKITKTYELSAALESGVAVFDVTGYKIPAATELTCYTMRYNVNVSVNGAGNFRFSKLTLHSNYYSADSENSNTFFDYSAAYHNYSFGAEYNISDSYYMSLYTFGVDTTYNLKDGSTLSATLTGFGQNSVSGGKVLAVIYSQDVREYKVTDPGNISFTVNDKNVFPNARFAGAYFKDGVFYKVFDSGLVRDRTERVVEPVISTDKTEYKPGDTVTLTVTVNKKDGVLPGASVNVSVINAAIADFWSKDAITNALLSGVNMPDYFYSSYRDYLAFHNTGGMGGGGPSEENPFSDTIYFGSAITDENGKVTVTFTLPEGKVTSYRVTVHTANRELYSGSAIADIDAKSDYFLQPLGIKLAKATDDLSVTATLISDYAGTSDVTFRLNELNITKTTTAGQGKTAWANFGKVPAGDYTVTATATAKDSSKTHSITFPVKVAASTQHITEETETVIDESTVITPSHSPVTLRLMTAESARYFRYIDFARSVRSERFDTVISNEYADMIENRINGSTVCSVSMYAENYEKWNGDLKQYNVSLLPYGQGDTVLTALYSYLTTSDHSDARTFAAENEAEAMEAYLCAAVQGKPVLADLLYAKDKVSDDPYARTILSIAFSVCGDTVSAKNVLVPVGENASDGERALYAIALIYTDREAAAALIDELIKENPSETYLSLATSIYMKTGIGLKKPTSKVTVVYGDKSVEYTFGELEVVEAVLSTKEGDTVTFKNVSKNVYARYSYEATFTPKLDQHNKMGITCSIDDSVNLFGETTLRVDLSEVIYNLPYRSSGVLRIAIPNCFRQSGNGTTGENNVYTAYITGNSDPVITIPLMAVAPGEYTIEPAVLTASDGVRYFSGYTTVTVNE